MQVACFPKQALPDMCLSEYFEGKLSLHIAQNMKFSINNFFRKCDQVRSFLRIWSHLLKKSLMSN